MGNVPRKADGRRVFSPDFKQATVQPDPLRPPAPLRQYDSADRSY